jgi:hypothetical protein
VLRAVTLGEDPAGERHALRNALTVAQLCDEYSARENGKKATTLSSDKSRINLHIKPKLGKYRVTAVTSEIVEDFMHSMSAATGKRTVGLLGAIFTWAVKRKLRPDNPVSTVEKSSYRLSTAVSARRRFGKLNPPQFSAFDKLRRPSPPRGAARMTPPRKDRLALISAVGTAAGTSASR